MIFLELSKPDNSDVRKVTSSRGSEFEKSSTRIGTLVYSQGVWDVLSKFHSSFSAGEFFKIDLFLGQQGGD